MPQPLSIRREEQEGLPLPFLLHFLEAASSSCDGPPNSDPTIDETKDETSTDGRIDDDITDDEDEGWPDDLPPNTGVIADSNDKEDADYSAW